MQSTYMVVFVTCKDESEAAAISEHLLQSRLAACANAVPGLTSRFWWEGKIDQASETLLILKSEARLLSQIIQQVKAKHSYSVPEVIALPIIGGSPDYLKWVSAEVKRQVKPEAKKSQA